MEEWRTAPDGRAYTRAEFVQYYGHRHGALMWDRATRIAGAEEPGPAAADADPPSPQDGGAEELAARGLPSNTPPQQPVGADGLAAAAAGAPSPRAGGAEEPVAQGPPMPAGAPSPQVGGAEEPAVQAPQHRTQTPQPADAEEPGLHVSPSQPAGVPAPDLQAPCAGAPGMRSAGAEGPGVRVPPAGEAPSPPAGGPPSNPLTHRPVLLHTGELAEQRKTAVRRRSDLERLHDAARTELNRLISVQMNAGAGEPGDVSADFPWREYVATHRDAENLVGSGVVEFGAAAIAGTKDPNRGGWPRVDFVIYRLDGSYVRIHPGRTQRQDALPQYFPPPNDIAVAASDRWRNLPPQGFTWADAQQVPTTDRLSKKIAWAVLESLPEGPLDSGPDAAFKWWLWLGNLGPLSRDILGAGVVSAFLDRQGAFVRHLVCERSDGSQVTVALSLTRNGALETKSWCTRPPA